LSTAAKAEEDEMAADQKMGFAALNPFYENFPDYALLHPGYAC
jgi:hypothetical protein